MSFFANLAVLVMLLSFDQVTMVCVNAVKNPLLALQALLVRLETLEWMVSGVSRVIRETQDPKASMVSL